MRDPRRAGGAKPEVEASDDEDDEDDDAADDEPEDPELAQLTAEMESMTEEFRRHSAAASATMADAGFTMPGSADPEPDGDPVPRGVEPPRIGELPLELAHGLDDAGLRACATALDRFLADQAKRYDQALAELRSFAEDYQDADELPDAAGFAATVELDHVVVGLGDDDKPLIALVGGAEWEPEHGVAVVFAGDRVVESGYQDVASRIARSAADVAMAAIPVPPVMAAIERIHQTLPGRWKIPNPPQVMAMDMAELPKVMQENLFTAKTALLDLVPALLAGCGAQALNDLLDGWSARVTDRALAALLADGRRHLHGLWPVIRTVPAAAAAAVDAPADPVRQQLILQGLFMELPLVVHSLARDEATAAAALLYMNAEIFGMHLTGTPNRKTVMGRLGARMQEQLTAIRALPEIAPLVEFQARMRTAGGG